MVKNVPVTPPIIVNNKLVTNFNEKANIFNDFFGKQCQPIPNNNTRPSIQIFETSNRLNPVDIDSKKIVKLIQALSYIKAHGCNYDKAHGCDGISIRMLNICGTSIIKPLSLLFGNCLRVFTNNWKKQNVIPVHKKENKQKISNYCPVSLLPICYNIFEKLILHCIYDFFRSKLFV